MGPATSVRYFRAPPQERTQEVRFVLPEQPLCQKKPKPTGQKQERYCPPLLKVAALIIGYFLIFIPFANWTEYLRELDLYRPPPPELVPAHPTPGMVITDHHHVWIYWGPPDGVNNGWVDP